MITYDRIKYLSKYISLSTMESKRLKKHIPVFALLTGIFCTGFSALFVQWAGVPGGTSAFYRVLFSLLAIVPLWITHGSRQIKPKDFIVISIGGAFFATELVLWQMSLLRTTATNATLFVNLSPIWTGIIAVVFLKENQSKRFWIGSILAFLGMFVILNHSGGGFSYEGLGDIIAAISSVFYAFYLTITRYQRKTTNTINFLFFSTISSVVVLFFANFFLSSPLLGFSTEQWFSLIALGLITHFGGYFTINYALGYIPTQKIAISLLGQPVVTGILASLLLGDTISLSLILGGSIILLGLYFALAD